MDESTSQMGRKDRKFKIVIKL